MKKYALIILDDLAIRRFDHKDEWFAAMSVLRDKDRQFIVVKWNAGAKQYVQQEITE